MSTVVSSPAESPAKLLDVRGVAALLNCSPRQVYRLADAGRMPAPVKLGGLVRWSQCVIDEWVRRGCEPLR